MQTHATTLTHSTPRSFEERTSTFFFSGPDMEYILSPSLIHAKCSYAALKPRGTLDFFEMCHMIIGILVGVLFTAIVLGVAYAVMKMKKPGNSKEITRGDDEVQLVRRDPGGLYGARAGEERGEGVATVGEVHLE